MAKASHLGEGKRDGPDESIHIPQNMTLLILLQRRRPLRLAAVARALESRHDDVLFETGNRSFNLIGWLRLNGEKAYGCERICGQQGPQPAYLYPLVPPLAGLLS